MGNSKARNGKLAGLIRMGVLAFAIVIVAISCDQARNAPSSAQSDIRRITTAEHFDTAVLKAPGPVLVDFYADWCGPCRRLAPVLEALAGEYESQAVFVRVNVDQAGPLARRYGVSGIPDVRIFRQGQVVAKIVGLNGAEKYRAALNTAIADNNRKATVK